MLQISSGRFFNDGDVNSHTYKSVLYSNLRLPNAISAIDTQLSTASAEHDPVCGYDLRYVVRYEPRPPDPILRPKGDFLVVPSGDESIDQYRLLATLWFEAIFSKDRYHVESLCRSQPRFHGEREFPSGFVDRYFSYRSCDENEVAGFIDFVTRFIRIPRRAFRLLMSCIAAFDDALEAIDANPDLAYSMFVYALETLTQESDNFVPSWEDFPEKARHRLDKHFEGMDADDVTKIKDILLDSPTLRLKKRFVEFVSQHVADSFFIEEARDRKRAIRRNELQRALANLYDSRSKYVHTLKQIQEHVRIPNWAPQADLLYWEHEPYLTFSGIARLSRHVFQQFMLQQPASEHEDYSGWRDELPGTIRIEMAPEYWVWNMQGLRPDDAARRFNGFISLVVDRIDSKPITLPDIRPLIAEIERLLPQSSQRDKTIWLCIYRVFHYFASDSDRRPNWERIVESNQSAAFDCQIAVIATQVLMGEMEWSAADCGVAFEAYVQSKFKRNSVCLPHRLEVAVMCAIANLHMADGDHSRFAEWINRTILDAAGFPTIQAHLDECRRSMQPVSINPLADARRVPRDDSEDK